MQRTCPITKKRTPNQNPQKSTKQNMQNARQFLPCFEGGERNGFYYCPFLCSFFRSCKIFGAFPWRPRVFFHNPLFDNWSDCLICCICEISQMAFKEIKGLMHQAQPAKTRACLIFKFHIFDFR